MTNPNAVGPAKATQPTQPPGAPLTQPRVALTAIAISALVVNIGFFIRRIKGSVIDDAFITFTYSANIAKGLGATFSGGARIEATSSILWAALLAPFDFVGIGSPVGSQLLGALFAILTVYFSIDLCRKMLAQSGDPFGWEWLSGLLLATTSSFALWSIYGMENSLVAFLLVIAIRVFASDLTRKHYVSLMPIVLLTLTRPEGFVFALVFALLMLVSSFTTNTSTKARFFGTIWVAGLVTSMVLLETCRIFYYGDFFPNTASVKVPHGQYFSTLYVGIRYLLRPDSFLNTLLIVGSIGLFLVASFGQWNKSKQSVARSVLGCTLRAVQNTPIAITAGTMLLAQILFAALVGGDWMPDGRFLSHTMAVASPLFVWGVAHQVCANPMKRWIPRLFLLVVVGYVAANACLTYNLDRGILRKYTASTADGLGVHGIVAFLNKTARAGESVACPDIGYISYHFQGRVIDWYGLANREIAKSGQGGGRIQPSTLLGMEPRFIVLYSNRPDLTESATGDGRTQISQRFLANAQFRREYRQVFSTMIWPSLYYTVWDRL